MVKIFSPNDEIQLALVKSLLEAEGIPYFVHNDQFGSMQVGIQIELLNRRTVMVAEPFAERARAIVAEFLENSVPEHQETARGYTFREKFRMVFEALVFGWFMPGRRRRIEKPDSEEDRP